MEPRDLPDNTFIEAADICGKLVGRVVVAFEGLYC